MVKTNDPGSPFAGKDVCQGAFSYFNGDIVLPTTHQIYSYHPNKQGQAALGSLFRTTIG